MTELTHIDDTGAAQMVDVSGKPKIKRTAWAKGKIRMDPATIKKQVADIMEAAYPAPGKRKRRVAEDGARYDAMTPEQLMKRAAKLEKKMLRHARDLEFEEAARLRDEIKRIREEGLGLSDRKAG